LQKENSLNENKKVTIQVILAYNGNTSNCIYSHWSIHYERMAIACHIPVGIVGNPSYTLAFTLVFKTLSGTRFR
jgi:hypothetical protein